MLKKYKNDFADIIRKQGFDPTEFTVTEDQKVSYSLLTIRFRNSPLKFFVATGPNSIHTFDVDFILFDAGFPRCYKQNMSPDGKANIGDVNSLLAEWLQVAVRPYTEEMSLPDFWQQVEQQRQLVNPDRLTDDETSTYTEAEKQQLRLSISQFRMLLCETFQPMEDQLEIINERLDYLSTAVDRLNRFDWKGLALSIVVGIGINLCVDTEGGRKLFELFRQVFSGVLHLLPGSCPNVFSSKPVYDYLRPDVEERRRRLRSQTRAENRGVSF